MKESNKLDTFIRQKLAEQAHPYKEEHWLAAEELIEADKRNRRKRGFLFFLWGGFLGIGLVLVGLGLWGLLWRKALDQDRVNSSSAIASVVPQLDSQLVPTFNEEMTNPSRQVPERTKTATQAMIGPAQAKPSPNSPKRYNEGVADMRSWIDNPDEQQQPIQAFMPAQTQSKRLDTVAINPYEEWIEQRPFRLSNRLSFSSQNIDWLDWKANRHALAVEIGAQWSPTWEAQGSGSIHPLAGLHYRYWINPNWRVSLGVRYAGRGGLSSDYRFSDVQFGLGRQQIDSVFQPNRLHRLEIPLRIEKHLTGRHYLSAGIAVSWLLETTGQIQIIERTNSEVVDQSRIQTGGLRYGFKRLDPRLELGYGYYVGAGTQLKVSAVYGLSDLTERSFFEQDRFDRHLGIRLSLSHQIGK